jgi:hypothetical protein
MLLLLWENNRTQNLDVHRYDWIATIFRESAIFELPIPPPGKLPIQSLDRMQDWINNHTSALWVILPLYFATLWLGVSAILSFIGGWATLAKRFRYAGSFDGVRLNFQSGRMGMTSYGRCLTVGASAEGLYLAVMLPFRFCHPRLLIPWNEVSVAPPRGLLFKFVRLGLGRDHNIPLRLRPKIVEKLKQYAGAHWPTALM